MNTNLNPNSRYLSLTLFKNAGYETHGYDKVMVRNVWHTHRTDTTDSRAIWRFYFFNGWICLHGVLDF